MDCKSNKEYWTELDFEGMELEDIECEVGRFVLATLVQVKRSALEEPCMHLSAVQMTEEAYQEMKSPKEDVLEELQELMKDVQSGRSTGDNS